MKKLLGLLMAGSAMGVLAAALPALAETVNVPPSQTINTQITDGTSANTLTINGNGTSGTVDLTNPGNSYSGGTIVQNGATLQVGADSELGASSGALTLGNSGTGTLDLTPTTSTQTSSRNISIGGGGGTIITNPNYAWTFGGAIGGGGVLTVTGNGQLDLTNTSNGFGGETITGGATVQVGQDDELGNSGSTLTLGSGSSSGTLDLNGANTSDAAVVSVRPITLGGSGGTILTNPNYAWTFEGLVSGTSPLTITSASGASGGTVTLTNTNTYTGGTVVSGGSTLSVSSDLNLGVTDLNVPTGSVTLGTGGILSLNNGGPVSSIRSVVLNSGGGEIQAEGSPWTFTSPVTGVGGLTVAGTGEVVLDGANTYAGGTTVAGGTLEIGDGSSPGASVLNNVTVDSGATLTGQGTVTGSVTSDGIVNPGGGGIGNLRVQNGYTQNADGTLEISIAPNAASELQVTGAANIAGNLTLNPLGLLHAGTYTFVTATGGLTTSALNAVAPLSVGFTQNLVNSNGTLQLQLTQNTSIPENPSIYPALANAALDDAQRGTDTVLTHLTNARSAGSLDDMVVATSADHLTDDCNGCSPFGEWFQPFGGVGSTNSSGAAPGYNSNDVGFLTGIDIPVSDEGDDAKYVAGLAVGYSRTTINESGGATGKVSTPRVIAYGSWWTGPYAVDATLGLGYADFSSDRPIAGIGSASGSYHGVQITSSVQASRVFDINSFILTPAAGVEFARQAEQAFEESGASYYNLDALSANADSLRPFVSATLAKRFDVGLVTRIEPQIRVAYAEETLNSPNVSVDPTADDYTFKFPGVTPSRGRASVNAGITVETSHNLNIFTDAGVVEAGNAHGEQFDAGLRYRF